MGSEIEWTVRLGQGIFRWAGTLAGEGGNDMLKAGGTLLVWMVKSRHWRDGEKTRLACNAGQWRAAA